MSGIRLGTRDVKNRLEVKGKPKSRVRGEGNWPNWISFGVGGGGVAC